MRPGVKLLGWNEIEVRQGSVSRDEEVWEAVAFDWQPGSLRNCSYSSVRKLIALSSEDRTNGGQVLALHDPMTKSTSFLLRMQSILHNSINDAGTRICYTVPATEAGAASLYLMEIESGEQHRMECTLAQDSIPDWFPNDERVVFHNPDREIEVLRLSDGTRDQIKEGTHPAVSPDGQQLAFLRDGQIWLWSLSQGTGRALNLEKGWFETAVLAILSWSPDGQWLSLGVSSGITSKETVFYLYGVATEEQYKLGVKYLSGMIIIG